MLNWEPTANFVTLKLRAEILAKIRTFFAQRNILEVETPLLSHATVTDIHLHSFHTCYQFDNLKNNILYLQTSPEYAMKRLLAAGSGPIYQICKAFRNVGESGHLHNPEFSLLEWYRPNFDHFHLMNEVDELLSLILNTLPAERITYAKLFLRYTGIDPHHASINELKNKAIDLGIFIDNLDFSDRDSWLHLLMSHVIEPQLGRNNRASFVYDFPASQAALARIRVSNPPVAERVEVYLEGMELANGFHELSDANEQRQRFINDLKKRRAMNLPLIPMDENLLSALEHGLPNCAGIALGIDRLIMLAIKAKHINETISFPLQRA